jgi:hypothetical protein
MTRVNERESASHGHRGLRRALAGVLLALTALTVLPPSSSADPDASAFRDLAVGTDFRVRVAAALTLGKSSSAGARPALERALGDAHPAVRAAAAAALGALADARALPSLRAALATESVPDVKAAIDRTIQRLATSGASGSGNTPPNAKARFLVSLGKLENRSGLAVDKLAPALKSSTRSRMAQVPGVEVLADGTDPGVESKSRNLPAFTVDGSLTKLDKQQGAENIGYAARVEYVIRKMPEAKLAGSMRGSAAAFADTKQVKGPDDLAQLQIDALSAAVDQALKGATPTLESALR